MSTEIKKIDIKNLDNIKNLVSKNNLVFKNITDLDQDFGKLLEKEVILRYEECEDINIVIESKINRIILVRCSNINIKINGLITGIEIKQCDQIYISNQEQQLINSIIVEASSDINFKLSKTSHLKTVYDVDKISKINIKDYNDKVLVLKNK